MPDEQWQKVIPVKLSHWTVVVPPPELVALAVELVVVPPEVDDDVELDADADANAEEPLAVAVAEELVEPHVHVHAIASPPLNAKTSKSGNAKLFRTLIMAASPVLPNIIVRPDQCFDLGQQRRPLIAAAGSGRAAVASGTGANSQEPHTMNLAVAAWLSAIVIVFCLIAVAGGFWMGMSSGM
jgi:hypothetical protein